MSVDPGSHRMRRWRGLVLELVDSGHKNQERRMDYGVLWGLMQDMGSADISGNDILVILQDLMDRGYITATQTRNKWTNRVAIDLIQITPAGRDLIEGTKTDSAVRLLL